MKISMSNETKRAAARWAFAEAPQPPVDEKKHLGEVLPELSLLKPKR
jgi:hypothetical protein